MRTISFVTLVFFAALSNAYAEEDLKKLLQDLHNEVKELRAQVKESNARISELEQSLEQERLNKQAKEPEVQASSDDTKVVTELKPSINAVTVGDVKGTIKLPGSDTSIGFGGFTKLHMMYTDVSIAKNKWGHQEFYGADIPVDDHHQSGQFNAQVKESRLWFKSYTPSTWGDSIR